MDPDWQKQEIDCGCESIDWPRIDPAAIYFFYYYGCFLSTGGFYGSCFSLGGKH